MSDKKTCEKCGGSDFTAGGKCRSCMKGRNKKAAAAKAKKPKSAAKATVELIIDASFGFDASITDEGYLQVQQRGQDGEVTDTLVLSRPEFRQLVDKFTPWAAAC